ncbi:MAG: FAD-dependent oxidoreductase [Allorhizobium sp.]
MPTEHSLPVAIVGAGPVGLAAAAHLVSRGLKPVVFERAGAVGQSLREWGHVRLFSPWRYVLDAAAKQLLEAGGWQAPDLDGLPTGADIVERYLAPLAALPELAPHIMTGSAVTAISRQNLDKLSNSGRAASPFVIRYTDASGAERAFVARAVLDASGTWGTPNPIGVDGVTVPGERTAGGKIAYGVPDAAGFERDIYRDRDILVIGSGHSAINVVLALIDLQKAAPATRISWGLRGNRIEKLLGGGANDQLPARGALGLAARKAIDSRRLRLLAPLVVERIERDGDGLCLEVLVAGEHQTITADRIIVATGFRPDLSPLRELRLDLDPAVEAPRRLAPMIDPNLHACGSVPAHGVDELAQPEPGFYIIGSKSYGRAPTFLMATGYEQARSVVAELAGDHKAAREVHLVLPETGVCSSDPIDGGAKATGTGCCGGPAPAGINACCLSDAIAKADEKNGCGCGTASATGRRQAAE